MGTADISALAAGIDRELRAIGTPERAVQEKAYLKTDLEFFGATVPQIRAITRAALRTVPAANSADVVALAESLWSAPVHERRMAAIDVLIARRTVLDPSALAVVERFLRDAGTWALVDALAADVAGHLVVAQPSLVPTLDRWASDPEMWVRRSAMLALLPPLRRGGGDFERFGRYADAMLDEKEFFIRKAIGWVLREVAKKRPELVFDWLEPRIGRASGVTVREAVKYLPILDRDRLVAAYRSR